MRPFRRVALPLAAATALFLMPDALVAQTCLGNPSFAQGHLQLSGDVVTGNDVTTFGARWGGGSESVFGTLGVGGATLDGVSGSQLLAAGSVGYQVPATVGTAQICPVFTAQFGFGPKDIDGFGTDLTSRAVGFGLALGGELLRGSRMAVVPSVQLGFLYAAQIFDGVGSPVEEADTYGTAGLTLGIVLNDQLSLRPNVTFPIGLEGADPLFGIGFTLNYGGRR